LAMSLPLLLSAVSAAILMASLAGCTEYFLMCSDSLLLTQKQACRDEN
jgi:hypothetical protein